MARRFIRVTGRVSLSVFLVPFTTPALQRLRPSPAVRALAGRRFEALAVVTAVELIHGLGIVSLLVVYTRDDRRLPPLPFIEALGGAVGYGVLLADLVAATPAFTRASPQVARRLGQVADWYLYGVFSADALDAPLRRGRSSMVYVPMGVALLAAGAVRAIAATRPTD